MTTSPFPLRPRSVQDGLAALMMRCGRHFYLVSSRGKTSAACRDQPSKVLFAMVFTAVSSSKALRLYSHAQALRTRGMIAWGPSLVYQDVLLLLVYRLLLDIKHSSRLRRLAKVMSSALAWVMLNMAAVSVSFYLSSGSDVQWRNMVVLLDPSWWPMLPQALLTFTVVTVLMLVLAKGSAEMVDSVATAALHVLHWPMSLFRSRGLQTAPRCDPVNVGPDEEDSDVEKGPLLSVSEHEGGTENGDELQQESRSRPAARHIITALALVILVASTVFRPDRNSLFNLSWTLPLLPMAELMNQSTLGSLQLSTALTDVAWDNVTALGDPIPLSWLPRDRPLPGFEDWYGEDKEHYDASADPLKASNLDQDLLPALHGKLKDVNVRHVVLLVLESTRGDVFPLKKDGFIWNQLVKSFVNGTLPSEAENMLSSLTPTANFITGDYNDGFEHPHSETRGGITANNAHTGSGYTLKSLVATLCGLAPAVADFNVEFKSHFYQPCLPHILHALNTLNHSVTNGHEQDFVLFPWRSTFMQSAWSSFDNQEPLMAAMGYAEDEFIQRTYLESITAKFGPVNDTETNYFSIPEVSLEKYIRHAFQSANVSKERVFLSHLTSTTHHAWGIPTSETYVPLAGSSALEHLSHYLNCIKYQDRWLAKILAILEEEGVADETLVIVTGDHGTPVAEGGVATYNNPNAVSYHVPLVFSHPKLPRVEIGDAVTSLAILPTLLDLLIASNSLSNAAREAARDLLRNEEEQSLLRPQKMYSDKGVQGHWQFTVTNPGGTTVSVRDGRHPGWHLMVPLAAQHEWRFVDLDRDPSEEKLIISFDIDALHAGLEQNHGPETLSWAKEAAVVCRWWLEENKKRWRYSSRHEEKDKDKDKDKEGEVTEK